MTSSSSTTRRGLRFGIMCDGMSLRAWQARCIEHLLDVPGVEAALLIVDDRAKPRTRRSRFGLRPNLLWDLYNNRWVAGRARALRKVALPEPLAGLPQVRCHVETRGRFSEHFSEEDLRVIEGHELDFILRFAFGIIRGGILETPRYGVWSYHHDDEQRIRGGPPAFWELVEREPVTGAVLQRLTDRLDGGVVLAKGHFRTVRHSYVRNTDDVHLGSVEWPAKVCREIQAGVAQYLEDAPSTSTAPVYRKPTNLRMSAFMLRLVGTFVAHQTRQVFRSDQWNVGVVDAPIERFLDASFVPHVEWWPAPAGRSQYVADPFGVEHDGEMTVLFEAFDYRTQLGVIEWRASGAGGSRTAIDLSEHASYPYIVRREGDIYCIPQLAETRGVHLFRATSFPDTWERAAVLVEVGKIRDATVLCHDGRWWLFATDALDGALTKLRVWWADDLLGPWTPHPGNPVKTDVRSARPAGTPFVHDGTVYRPAQDCSSNYGGAVALNRVDDLSTTRYRETLVHTIAAPQSTPWSRGMHTLSSVGSRTLVDGKRHVFSPASARAEVAARLRRNATP